MQPGREGTGVVLGQHADEALDRAELGRVDHHRLGRVPVRAGVGQPEPGRLVEVVLDGRHLPGASDGVLGLNGDLRAVIGGTTGIVDDNKPGFVGDFGQDLGRGLPLLVGADELVLLLADLVAGRQLERDIGQAEVLQQAEDETQQVPHLVRGLFGGAVRVRIVLGDGPDAGQSLHHTGLLVAVDGAELE
ncbi:hypothetical protein SDC9_169083 [bioreactor metagenome]|uniref:Uncharacterized protein n=1 Tax=bioreactor metagenome TaxID=1076179 RepID=A0A645GCY3_9ZZZZ